eukprot:SAG31_NODE_1969_length_6771_cov_17.211331_4_plen_182_part_00
MLVEQKVETFWLSRELLKLLPQLYSQFKDTHWMNLLTSDDSYLVEILEQSTLLTNDFVRTAGLSGAGIGLIYLRAKFGEKDRDLYQNPSQQLVGFEFQCMVPLPRFIFQQLEKVFLEELQMRAAMDEPSSSRDIRQVIHLEEVRRVETEMMLLDVGDLRTTNDVVCCVWRWTDRSFVCTPY